MFGLVAMTADLSASESGSVTSSGGKGLFRQHWRKEMDALLCYWSKTLAISGKTMKTVTYEQTDFEISTRSGQLAS
jgi:hypothetical protein